MEKDITIINLIAKLKDKIDFSLLEIVDYWETDLCAIGIKKENKIVYISTYNYATNSPITYDFDLELTSSGEINLIKQGRNVSYPLLIDEIKLFLEV